MQIRYPPKASSCAMRSAQSGRKLGARAERNCELVVSGKISRMSPQTNCSTAESIDEELSHRVVIDEIKFGVPFDAAHPFGAKEVAMHELDRSGSRTFISDRILVPSGFLLLIASLDGGLTDFESKGIISETSQQQDIIALSTSWHQGFLPSPFPHIILHEACA